MCNFYCVKVTYIQKSDYDPHRFCFDILFKSMINWNQMIKLIPKINDCLASNFKTVLMFSDFASFECWYNVHIDIICVW